MRAVRGASVVDEAFHWVGGLELERARWYIGEEMVGGVGRLAGR